MAVGFLVLLSFNILFALVAALLIAYEVLPEGMGVAERIDANDWWQIFVETSHWQTRREGLKDLFKLL